MMNRHTTLDVEALEEEEWVLRNVGKKRCKFRIPTKRKGETTVMKGTLKERVALYTKSITRITDFWDVIDLIEFEWEGETKRAVRFGYYRRGADGKLRWGSQTTLTEDIDVLKALFRKAVKEKSWFKQLLTEALASS